VAVAGVAVFEDIDLSEESVLGVVLHAEIINAVKMEISIAEDFFISSLLVDKPRKL